MSTNQGATQKGIHSSKSSDQLSVLSLQKLNCTRVQLPSTGAPFTLIVPQVQIKRKKNISKGLFLWCELSLQFLRNSESHLPF